MASRTSALYASPGRRTRAWEIHDDLAAATQLPGHQHGVDCAPHAAAVADVGMIPCRPHQRHGIAHQAIVALEAVSVGARPLLDDLPLEGLVLVSDGQPAETVVDAHGDAHRSHVVEGVHRCDQPECGLSCDRADPGDRQPAVADGGEQCVQRVLRAPVELLYVEETAEPHGLDQRSVDEVLGQVPLAQHAVGCMVPDKFPGRQVGIPLDEHEGHAPVRRDGAQHGGLTGAGGTLEQHVAARGDRRPQELELACTPHHPGCGHKVGLLAVIDGHGRAI